MRYTSKHAAAASESLFDIFTEIKKSQIQSNFCINHAKSTPFLEPILTLTKASSELAPDSPFCDSSC